MDNREVIGQAIVFIENHLYEPIAACDAAKAVSYSYHHFHRYFSAVMGETIGSYIRSRRLTQAAWELVHTSRKVIDIGLSLRFDTAEGFARAFKERYSMTPTEYRKNGIDVLIGSRQTSWAPDRPVITYAGMSPEIVAVPEVSLMGLRFRATVGGMEMVPMWQKFASQIPAELLSNNRYGVFEAENACSSEAFHTDSTAAAFVGVEIPENYPVPRQMQEKKLCGGDYARFIHKGTVDTLIQTYHYIWGVWFPKSEYDLADREDFECYTGRFLGADDERSEIDIYFPIKLPNTVSESPNILPVDRKNFLK